MKIKLVRLAVLGILACADSMPAQTRTASTEYSPPAIAYRPFVLAAFQRFAAHDTFQAVFGRASHPF
ncbi:MAG: hypothetical protein ACRD4E_13505, partial [Bryobacteraceae bacterium]